MLDIRRTSFFVVLGALSACHDDACLWSTTDDRGEGTATLYVDLSLVGVTSLEVRGTTYRSLRDDRTTTRLRLFATVANDPVIDALVVETAIGDPQQAPSVLALDAGNGAVELARGGAVIAEATPTGTLTLHALDVPCELSDTYQDRGRDWACATNLDATLDVRFVSGGRSYVLAGSVSHRERLTEECHPCGGIEGCSY